MVFSCADNTKPNFLEWFCPLTWNGKNTLISLLIKPKKILVLFQKLGIYYQKTWLVLYISLSLIHISRIAILFGQHPIAWANVIKYSNCRKNTIDWLPSQISQLILGPYSSACLFYLCMTNININYWSTFIKSHMVSFLIIIPEACSLKMPSFMSMIHVRKIINLHLPKCRTSLRQHTVIFQGPKFWNMLPSEIRSSPSLGVFKCKLRNLLLFS